MSAGSVDAVIAIVILSRTADAPPTCHRSWGMPLKWRVLPLLVVQNAATTLLVRRTRVTAADGSTLYLGAAVMYQEL